MPPAESLRAMVANEGLLVAPGAYDGLSAKLVEAAGFPLVYASGGAIARSRGLPDLNLLSLSEIVAALESIVEAVPLPVIADADTGHGGVLNVHRSIRRFQRAGVAGFHIEDQTFPKRCGHYDDKSVVEVEVMLERIRAARDAAEELVLIARTDALASEPFEAVMTRAQRYMDAGADMIFVEAPRSEEEIEAIAKALPYPKLINMFHGGKTPLVAAPRLAELGYRVMIVPSDLQRAAIGAMQRTLGAIRAEGHSLSVSDAMASFDEREAIVGTERFLKQANDYSS